VVVVFPRAELIRNEQLGVDCNQPNLITVPFASAVNDVGAVTMVAVVVTAALEDPAPGATDRTLNVYTPGVPRPVIVADFILDVAVPL
jgi:hypothetical protein